MNQTEPQDRDDTSLGTGRCRPQHLIEIRAPVERVWELLMDFNSWSRWNPLYVESEGTFAVGEMVQFAVQLPGMKPGKGTARVAEVRPKELLRYELSSMGGLVRATRFIELRQPEPGLCTVRNGEIMGGLLGPLLFLAFGERVRQGLQGMNEALKPLAEEGQS